MKNSIFSSILMISILSLNFSCQKNIIDNVCYSAKILKTSCGGVVLQLLSDENLGKEWHDASNNVTYQNCVLAGIIPSENKVVGDTIYIKLKKVDSFSNGNFCDIGGLPPVKIEIKNLYSDSCLN